MSSNLSVRSNLMIVDEQHKYERRYLPGDFFKLVYPDLADNRVSARNMTPQQIVELKQYHICLRCRRPCSGTCG